MQLHVRPGNPRANLWKTKYKGAVLFIMDSLLAVLN